MTPPILLPLSTDQQAKPLVSVVMPAFNRAELMRHSAEMILNQSLYNLELIISDDHSTDHTADVASELMSVDTRVRYHRPSKKGGINTVLNEGIKLARGKYIHICHDHDFYLPLLCQSLAELMERHPTVVFAHPGRQGCDFQGNPLPQAKFVMNYPEVSDGLSWRRLMLSRMASPVTGLSMIRRKALEHIGLFDPEFGACSDLDMWLRLCTIGDVGYVRELLLYIRGREPNHPYSGVNWDITDEVIRIHRKHLRLAYHGLEYVYWKLRREINIDLNLSFDYLNCIRHRRSRDYDNGRLYLRKHGGVFSKGVAYLL